MLVPIQGQCARYRHSQPLVPIDRTNAAPGFPPGIASLIEEFAQFGLGNFFQR